MSGRTLPPTWRWALVVTGVTIAASLAYWSATQEVLGQ